MHVPPKKLGVQWATEGQGFSQILGFGGWIDPVTERPELERSRFGFGPLLCGRVNLGKGFPLSVPQFPHCNITLIKSTSQH